MNANARVFPQFYVGEGIWFRRSAVCFRARGATQQSDEIKGDCFAAGAAKKQWANLDDRGAACSTSPRLRRGRLASARGLLESRRRGIVPSPGCLRCAKAPL